jgi:aldehyde dehydrogenase (NAD+)
MSWVNTDSFLSDLSIDLKNPCWFTGQASGNSTGPFVEVHSPADGRLLGSVQMATKAEYDHVIEAAELAYLSWRMVPAPKRGEIVRQIGDELRKYKDALGHLVSIEMGKILQEGLGEVQEMIDICDFAVGLSRQMYGLTMHSERPLHRMYEQYHPLGVVGIISAFNFPVAVWAWNSMLAAVCGNTSVWKPSEKTPLTAVACMHIMKDVLKRNNLPEGIFGLVVGDRVIGEAMASDKRAALVSATGSTRMGRAVGETVARRFGKVLLELGGNNAIIITPNANLDLALPAVLFGSVGTCGQRCTTTRRLIIHESMYERVKESLLKAHKSLRSRIGHPLKPETLISPLIDKAAVAGLYPPLGSRGKRGWQGDPWRRSAVWSWLRVGQRTWCQPLLRQKTGMKACRRKLLPQSFTCSSTAPLRRHWPSTMMCRRASAHRFSATTSRRPSISSANVEAIVALPT